ncbi:MAG: site-specific DNA-methyltransferase [Gammaproteobacteria bacterium]|nr:site-specific DNA-methyltransferase [Gammaproteobacteria bacterium]
MPKKPRKAARDYRHKEEALLRPESGAQDVFPPAKRKPPRSRHYDSSLSPELAWDEAEVRGKGEQLIREIIDSGDLDQARRAAEKLKSLSASFLNWSGKAERGSLTVPTLPLFVHERLSTQAVLATLKRRHPRRGQTLDLFGESERSIGEKIRGAYEHLNGWQNRLILGDSLQVMNSLLEYEGLGGQVQMVYMDPPYGVKFGGNFQPFVRQRNVKDGDDNAINREPEMIKAYRDTWTLGIHSWLTYMRDRLLLAREMLSDSGSCFVQISDENVHLVRCLMDEVFGRENFCSIINYRTTTNQTSKIISSDFDYVIWYAKAKNVLKFRKIYIARKGKHWVNYDFVRLPDGTYRKMTSKEKENPDSLPDGSKIYRRDNLTAASKSDSTSFDFPYKGKKYSPHKGGWSTNIQGMNKLMDADRLEAYGNTLSYRRYSNDFPYFPINNSWNDTATGGYGADKIYVVQTSEKVIQRCILMTTDPGDLVFDPTCGSGTTACVAEQWGRRWITTDVSRVPLALARQRLLTATYPYYQLKDEQRGPAGGFVYARRQNKKGEEVGGIVPHITLKSIANDEPPSEEVLVDKPEIERNVARVTGPFCVEAVLPTPLSPEANGRQAQEPEPLPDDEDCHIERMIKVLRQSPELKLQANKTFRLAKVRPPAKSLSLHAEAENPDNGEAIAIVFGPANGAISERAVIEAGKEARAKDYRLLLVIAFAIEPAARQTVARSEATFGLPAFYAQASTDLVMSDLLKNTRSSQLFAVVGLPDIKLEKTGGKAEDGADLWQATLQGLDVFDPATMEHGALQGDDVPCWMLDTDYDGQCFRAGQVFFPRTAAWDKIRRAVRADFDEAVWEHLRGAVSAPFVAGEQVAVKVLDDRGNELLVVRKTADAE